MVLSRLNIHIIISRGKGTKFILNTQILLLFFAFFQTLYKFIGNFTKCLLRRDKFFSGT